MRRSYAALTQNGAMAELRLLVYFPGFCAVTLRADGSGSLDDFNDNAFQNFRDVSELHELLVSYAVAKRLTGSGKK